MAVAVVNAEMNWIVFNGTAGNCGCEPYGNSALENGFRLPVVGVLQCFKLQPAVRQRHGRKKGKKE